MVRQPFITKAFPVRINSLTLCFHLPNHQQSRSHEKVLTVRTDNGSTPYFTGVCIFTNKNEVVRNCFRQYQTAFFSHRSHIQKKYHESFSNGPLQRGWQLSTQ